MLGLPDWREIEPLEGAENRIAVKLLLWLLCAQYPVVYTFVNVAYLGQSLSGGNGYFTSTLYSESRAFGGLRIGQLLSGYYGIHDLAGPLLNLWQEIHAICSR